MIDKINMHQAFDLDQDLIELSKLNGFPTQKNVINKTIFTTNNKNESTSLME